MSKCISAKGEYSEHAPGEEEEFVCGRCYVVDEEAMRAEIERLRADRPPVTDNTRANPDSIYEPPAWCPGCGDHIPTACPDHSEHVWNPRTGMWEQPAETTTETDEGALMYEAGYKSGYHDGYPAGYGAAYAEMTTATDEDALSDEERIVRAIGNDPVAVSGHTNGEHWGGWTHRTARDRDDLVQRLLPLLAEVRAEAREAAGDAQREAKMHYLAREGLARLIPALLEDEATP